ncbi:MAG: molybdate ABC transporter substrate-binding protein [Acidobacteria bacterium]|nr:molybdate ABC transporter substrate-binding protein [Acidobacteriota bacterium]
MIRVILLVLLTGAGLLAANQGSNREEDTRATATVRVAAAADLKFALDDVAARLASRRPAVRIEAIYGSSGSMHAQLRQRAPYDVYLSADVAYPRDLVSRGIGAERDLFTYAVGRIVVWVPNRSALPIERDGLGALTGALRIAIANPRHAPYGQAADAALRGAGLWDRLGRKLVLGENVAQAAQFVQSGAADAGIIARSLALAPAMRAAGRYWDVPEDAYPPLTQGGLILPWAVSPEGAAGLRDYLLSDEGRQLLASYGFGLPAR